MSPPRLTLARRALRLTASARQRIQSVWSGGWQWLRMYSFLPTWLPSQWQRPITGYLVGCALTVLAVGASSYIITNFPRFLFAGSLDFLVVVFLAFTFGAGPSLFATLVGTALYWYLVLTPAWSWSVARVEDVIGLMVYTGVGVSVAILASRVEQARQQATKERALARQLNARLQTTLDVLPVGVGIAETTGDLTLTNRAFQAIWGEPYPATPSELSGVTRRDAHAYHGWRLDGSPIKAQEWGLARAMRNGVSVLNDEIEIATSAGERRSVLYSAAPIQDAQGMVDGGVVVLLDITERRTLERRTHVALTTLLAMAESLAAPPPPLEVTGVAFAAPAEPWERERTRERAAVQQVLMLARQLFGGQYASVALVAQDTESVESALNGEALEPIAVVGLAPADAQRWWSVMSQAHLGDLALPFDKAQFSMQERTVVHVEQPPPSALGRDFVGPHGALLAALRLGDGRSCLVTMEVPERVEISPQDIELALATARVVGSLIEQERLLREREEARALVLALEESNRRMDVFLGIASHELRTPLTSAKMAAQLADRSLRRWRATVDGSATGVITMEQVTTLQELITQINNQMARQERLVNDLLDVSRLQTDALELRLVPCDLARVVREAVEEQRLLYPDRAITLDVMTSDEDVVVQGDADRIGQAITNYLSNALKYSSDDEVVCVSLEADERVALVRVQDQGGGIPLEAQERLWDRFYRAPGVPVLSGSGVGLGLGLYITRSIIERLGGQVGVTSAPAAGATFWFTLPRART